jgi:serine/threonine-protein kinase HipA
MIAIANVKIWDKKVGTVLWDQQKNHALFEFDKNFHQLGLDIAPIMMPLSVIAKGKKIYSFGNLNPDTFKGLPGLLSDSLPDKFGHQIIDAWLAQQGKNSHDFTPVDRLCYIGKRGMGALEFEPAKNNKENSNSIEIKELVKFAKEVLSERNEFHTNIANEKGYSDILQVGSSAGGARAKAVIAFNKETQEVRSGQIDGLKGFDYWLIKFDGVTNHQLGDPKGYGNIEYAYYLMAKECGITMMDSQLMTENGRSHFMTKRFDRQNGKKIHMQTLCGMAHFDYNQPRIYSYEQAFQVMRELKLPYSEMEEMYRRMVFNVMSRNQDDHTKNISFLMFPDGEWTLSPAYDITYAYNPDNFWLKSHQMSVNGKREEITLDDLLEVAKNVNIKKPMTVITKCNTIITNWPEYASKAGIEEKQIRLISKELLVLKNVT